MPPAPLFQYQALAAPVPFFAAYDGWLSLPARVHSALPRPVTEGFYIVEPTVAVFIPPSAEPNFGWYRQSLDPYVPRRVLRGFRAGFIPAQETFPPTTFGWFTMPEAPVRLVLRPPTTGARSTEPLSNPITGWFSLTSRPVLPGTRPGGAHASVLDPTVFITQSTGWLAMSDAPVLRERRPTGGVVVALNPPDFTVPPTGWFSMPDAPPRSEARLDGGFTLIVPPTALGMPVTGWFSQPSRPVLREARLAGYSVVGANPADFTIPALGWYLPPDVPVYRLGLNSGLTETRRTDAPSPFDPSSQIAWLSNPSIPVQRLWRPLTGGPFIIDPTIYALPVVGWMSLSDSVIHRSAHGPFLRAGQLFLPIRRVYDYRRRRDG